MQSQSEQYLEKLESELSAMRKTKTHWTKKHYRREKRYLAEIMFWKIRLRLLK